MLTTVYLKSTVAQAEIMASEGVLIRSITHSQQSYDISFCYHPQLPIEEKTLTTFLAFSIFDK